MCFFLLLCPLCVVQVVGSEERRRTLTPLALRERYNALNEPGLGKSCHAFSEALSLIYRRRQGLNVSPLLPCFPIYYAWALDATQCSTEPHNTQQCDDGAILVMCQRLANTYTSKQLYGLNRFQSPGNISTELPVMVCMALVLVAPLRVLLAWRIFSI